ncbi:CaiB/BaiF CoA transferase family protein [Zwartia vadi]|uniref:CaiB/BaiF CoA transferase family protein n=1 Tax=Zwartia vadi TaxID=3058168 RepID=UPI0025B29873|nr:CoA transferase [Zwartia vadi]MDN3988740.1 CoA transferase [Zwartia vadi]
MSQTDQSSSVPTGPLAGVRVLELSQIMAGPTCGMMLADMGADVIKIEKIPKGDDSRGYQDPRINGVSAPFLVLNRNKRGVALDLKNPKGADVLKRMVVKSDVLTENYRRGTLEKLGVGYEILRQLNPGLIYSVVSGYGRTGPLADKGGFDLIAQGFSGLMSITGHPGGPPAKTGNPVSDINAGILACVGVLAALVHRGKTGQGQIVDTSLMEAAMQQTYWQAAMFFATGVSAGPGGSAHPLTAPYQAFKTANGYLNIGGANQANWERVAETLGHPEWKTDPRFETNTIRLANREVLEVLIESELSKKTTEEWIEIFDVTGVPVGPVHSIEQAFSHPQAIAREMVVESMHPKAGLVKGVGFPIKFSEQPRTAVLPAPELGEHTVQVLREFGFMDAEIEDLKRDHVVLDASS